jgi:signal transduction histidine kinase
MFSRRTRWGLATAFWSFITGLLALQLWWLARQPGESIQIGRALVWQGTFHLSWIPLTVAIWELCGRWDPAALGWRRLLVRHALALVATGALQSLLVVLVASALDPAPRPESLGAAVAGQLRGRFYFQIIIYAGIATAGYSMQLYLQRRDRETQAATLAAQLASARLDALHAQLHPHFLFNSLHAISALVRDGRNADAVGMISDLSDLLRRVLDTEARERPLGDELDLVRKYAQIQHVRFGDRLRVDIEAPAEVLAAPVPALLVQPLVENAIRHGMSPRVDGTRVVVRARVNGAVLTVEVEDDGPGLPPGWSIETGSGTGLRNLRARLRALYGGAGDLIVSGLSPGGVRVTARLPRARP